MPIKEVKNKTRFYKVESCLNVLYIENKDLIEIYVALSKDYPLEYQFSISKDDYGTD